MARTGTRERRTAPDSKATRVSEGDSGTGGEMGATEAEASVAMRGARAALGLRRAACLARVCLKRRAHGDATARGRRAKRR